MTEEQLKEIETTVSSIPWCDALALVREVRRLKAMAAKWKRKAISLSPRVVDRWHAEDPELDEVQP